MDVAPHVLEQRAYDELSDGCLVLALLAWKLSRPPAGLLLPACAAVAAGG